MNSYFIVNVKIKDKSKYMYTCFCLLLFYMKRYMIDNICSLLYYRSTKNLHKIIIIVNDVNVMQRHVIKNFILDIV